MTYIHYAIAAITLMMGASDGHAGDDTPQDIVVLIDRIQEVADCRPSFLRACAPVAVAGLSPDWWPEIARSAGWVIQSNPEASPTPEPTSWIWIRSQQKFRSWCVDSGGAIKDQSPDAFGVIGYRREFTQQYTFEAGLLCVRRGRPSMVLSSIQYLAKYEQPTGLTDLRAGGGTKEEVEYVKRYNAEHANRPIRYLLLQTESQWDGAVSASREAEIAFQATCREGHDKRVNMMPQCQVLRQLDSDRRKSTRVQVIKGSL